MCGEKNHALKARFCVPPAGWLKPPDIEVVIEYDRFNSGRRGTTIVSCHAAGGGSGSSGRSEAQIQAV